MEHSPRVFEDRAEAHRWLRHQCFIAAGGAADLRLAAEVDRLTVDSAGHVLLSDEPLAIGLVTWQPIHR